MPMSFRRTPPSTTCCASCNNNSNTNNNNNNNAVKGNSGQAAQRRWYRQFVTTVVLLVVVVVAVVASSVTILVVVVPPHLAVHDHHHHHWDDRGRQEALPHLRPPAQYHNPKQRHKDKKQKQKQQQQSKRQQLAARLDRMARTRHTIELKDDDDDSNDAEWHDILHGRVHLVELEVRPHNNNDNHDHDHDNHDNQQQQQQPYDSSDLYGHFCALDWPTYHARPSAVAMFRDLILNSTDCQHRRLRVPWAVLLDRLRAHDASTTSHVMPLTGAIFHESRCGSTLVSNALAAMDPTHRVYTEAGPAMTAILRGCKSNNNNTNGNNSYSGTDAFSTCASPAMAVQLLRDVLYVWSRPPTDTNANANTNAYTPPTKLFVKFQSMGSHFIHTVFAAAFPTVPWIFVYRDPTEVLVSHLKGELVRGTLDENYNDPPPKDTTPSKRTANCLRTRRHPPSSIRRILDRYLPPSSESQIQHGRRRVIPKAQYCAAHLASLCESALTALHAPGSRGRALDYKRLPEALWRQNHHHDDSDNILATHFLGVALPSDAVDRIRATADQYSKGSALLHPRKARSRFVPDGTRKQELATASVQEAARLLLEPSYGQLAAFAAATTTTAE